MSERVVVIGAGAVGASAAWHLAALGIETLVLEKEMAPALHQSGRNSGVIHAGYNAKPGSQKAHLCHEGNKAMHAFCEEQNVPIRRGGICVVAQNEAQEATLEVLADRARRNRVDVEVLHARGLHRLEPHAQGTLALHAPQGSSVDSGAFVRAVCDQATAAGATVRYGCQVRSWTEDETGVAIQTNQGTIRGSALLNAAGLQADRVAAQHCTDLRVIPFRGFYARVKPGLEHLVRSHVYAAPDLNFPFLGVHLSKRTDGSVWVGPGAMLAFGREAYTFWKVQPKDLAGTLSWPGFWRMFGDGRVRGLVRSEVQKSLSLGAIWKEAKTLVPDLPRNGLMRASAGNRAQLVDKQGNMVDDIVVRDSERGVHVLNAVSPGLTCSLPFGDALAQRVARHL